jgi:hypothetical protein
MRKSLENRRWSRWIRRTLSPQDGPGQGGSSDNIEAMLVDLKHQINGGLGEGQSSTTVPLRVSLADVAMICGHILALSPLAGPTQDLPSNKKGTVIPGWELEVVNYWWAGVQWVWLTPGPGPRDLRRGVQVLPRRCRGGSLEWLSGNYWPCRDYELPPETEEAFICVGLVRPMLRRLARTAQLSFQPSSDLRV